ncbi:ABC transporter permease [bacterium]|nr:ABC transporter permease [bacterium]
MSFSYLFKRLIAIIPVLVIVSLITFSFIHLIPGDPAMALLGINATPAQINALRSEMGLDQPLVLQYFNWLLRTFQGDMGVSYLSGRSIFQSVIERLPHTLVLALLSIFLSVLIAIPSGIIAAARQNSISDRFVMLFSLIGVSVPSFWLGIMLVILFAVKLQWLPASGYVSIFEDFSQGIYYLILPTCSLAIVLAAVSARMMRASMLEILRQDYIRTARAKGLSRWASILKHGFKNSLIPVVTVIGINFGWLLGGTVVIETIFGIPGMGRLVIYSIMNRDYPMIQGVVLYMAVIYMLVNLLVDILVTALDSRIRY